MKFQLITWHNLSEYFQQPKQNPRMRLKMKLLLFSTPVVIADDKVTTPARHNILAYKDEIMDALDPHFKECNKTFALWNQEA